MSSGGERRVPRGAGSKGSVPYMCVPGAGQRDLRGEGPGLWSGGNGGGFFWGGD